MKTLVAIMISFALMLVGFKAIASSSHSLHSQYKGQEKRQIKTLSDQDIDDLKNGRGWGMAKAAELNGIPGPAHILELKTEIGLTAKQLKQIENLFEKMRTAAIPLGQKLINLERRLNSTFAEGNMNETILREMLDHIANVRQQLRYVHLSTHLKSSEILTRHQIYLYNKLRGYSDSEHLSPHGPGIHSH